MSPEDPYIGCVTGSATRLNHDKPGRLTWKQWAFVREYAVDHNGTRAARRAGYNGNSNVLAVQSSRLLRIPKVVDVLRAMDQAAVERVGLTRDDILRRLDENAEAARAAGHLSAAVRAIELIGKELGMFGGSSNRRSKSPIHAMPVFTLNLSRTPTDGKIDR